MKIITKRFRLILHVLVVIGLVCIFPSLQYGSQDSGVFTARDLLNTRTVRSASISPDGQWIAYTVNRQRCVKDEAGADYRELFLVSTRSGSIKPFITGKVSIGSLNWSPDSSRLAFLTKRGEKAKTQVWTIPVDGGEAVQLTHCKTSISSFQWHPNGKQIAYIAKEPPSKREKKLKDKGYGFTFFEENLKHKNIYLMDLGDTAAKPRQLTRGKTALSFVFSPDGKTIAAAMCPKNLIDHEYMFKRIHIVDVAEGRFHQLTQNPGKMGDYKFSPDGTRIVYTRALDRKDHAVSQVFVVDIKTKAEKNLTIPGFRGHVSWAVWKDNKTILYQAGEGVWPTLSLVPAAGGKRKVILNAKESGVTFRSVSFSNDFKHAAFVGSTTSIPGDLYYWKPGAKKSALKKMTDVNPWLANRKLGKQDVIRYKARDGLEIEGLLIYPADYTEGKTYPLVVTVHGGPESHYSNSWVSRYATPGQVLAGKGYAVFYPNYRASTGYGVQFALEGYKDAAGKEFDDIADGIDYLIKKGIADPKRVGLGGGSYGGFAAAWFGSYYTKYVRAVCMFVGISNLISKRGTTDIPYEELYVHSGDKLEKTWEKSLKRSPLYWAHQSKSAVLIFGGSADSRVHPSQSLEFYRRLKMNDHPATRLVQYPGEGHGNRKQPGKIDVLHRVLDWYDWYVKDLKPLDGPMPPLDISDKYGLELE